MTPEQLVEWAESLTPSTPRVIAPMGDLEKVKLLGEALRSSLATTAALRAAWVACCEMACPMGEDCKFRKAFASHT